MMITASQVKELRDKTGVGMMECKKALQESDGDLDKAIVYLREHGLSRAAKKAGRIAAEGLVNVYVNEDKNTGVILEVNCETDFVAKNDDFKKFVSDVAAIALKSGITEVEKIKEQDLAGKTIGETLTELISKIGENMNIRRIAVERSEKGTLIGYTHMGGKIATLVHLDGGRSDEIVELGKDIAMHAAAAAPRYLHESEVDKTELEQEKEIARKKLIEEKKPENMIEKILMGQMNKFYKEVCLLDQPFVKDTSVSISKHIENCGLGVNLTKFHRFQLGEGLEKRQENFAEEVKAQINK